MRHSLSLKKAKPIPEVIQACLAKKRVKLTQERRLILEEALATPGHFEADDLYLTLRSQGKRVSRATVYRTLDMLVHCGVLEQLSFGREGSRYERIYGRERHGHLYCLGCGEIVEFSFEGLADLQRIAEKEFGFRADQPIVQIRGFCRKCQ